MQGENGAGSLWPVMPQIPSGVRVGKADSVSGYAPEVSEVRSGDREKPRDIFPVPIGIAIGPRSIFQLAHLIAGKEPGDVAGFEVHLGLLPHSYLLERPCTGRCLQVEDGEDPLPQLPSRIRGAIAVCCIARGSDAERLGALRIGLPPQSLGVLQYPCKGEDAGGHYLSFREI